MKVRRSPRRRVQVLSLVSGGASGPRAEATPAISLIRAHDKQASLHF